MTNSINQIIRNIVKVVEDNPAYENVHVEKVMDDFNISRELAFLVFQTARIRPLNRLIKGGQWLEE